MDAEQRQHLKDLLQTYQRRLRVLEKQIATFGPRTAPEIRIEFEDTQAKIAEIEAQLISDSRSLSPPSTTVSDTTKAKTPIERGGHTPTSQLYRGASQAPRSVDQRPGSAPQRQPAIGNAPRSGAFSIPRWMPIGLLIALLLAVLSVALNLRNQDNANRQLALTEAAAAIPTQPFQAIVPAQSTLTSSTPIGIPLRDRIAFVSLQDSNYEIYTLNVDGRERKNITNTPESNEYSPAWSPDGRKIAFLSDRDRNGSCGEQTACNEIYIMNADGTRQPTRLTCTISDEGVPRWSPDGHAIAFQSNADNGNWDIYIMQVDAPCRQPTRLTFTAEDDLFPAWSINGKIAFQSYRDQNWEIYVMNADGTGQTNITQSSSQTERGPAWSSDGQRIAYSLQRDNTVDIYVMQADGTQSKALTHTADQNEWIPCWSPDGQRIVYHIGDGPPRQVYVISISDPQPTVLISDSADNYWPAWSPSPR